MTYFDRGYANANTPYNSRSIIDYQHYTSGRLPPNCRLRQRQRLRIAYR